MPYRTTIVRLAVIAAALLALAGCAGLAKPGEELWPYGYGAAEGPDDPPRLITPEDASAG